MIMSRWLLTHVGPCATAGLLMLAAGGCGGAGGLVEEPEATLQDARLIGLTTSTMDIELDYLIDNPNNYDLPIVDIGWNLALWSEPFANGVTELERDIPANGTSELTVPVTLSLDDVASGAEKLLDGKPIPYDVDGDITVDTPFGQVDLPYQKPGEWENPLSDLPFP